MKIVMNIWKNEKVVYFDGDMTTNVVIGTEFSNAALSLRFEKSDKSGKGVRVHLNDDDVSTIERSIGKYRGMNAQDKIGQINKLLGLIGTITMGELDTLGPELKEAANDIIRMVDCVSKKEGE